MALIPLKNRQLLLYFIFSLFLVPGLSAQSYSDMFLRWDGKEGRPEIRGEYHLGVFDKQVVAGWDDIRMWEYDAWTEHAKKPFLDTCALSSGYWNCPVNVPCQAIGIGHGDSILSYHWEYKWPYGLFMGKNYRYRTQEWDPEGSNGKIAFPLDFEPDGYTWRPNKFHDLWRMDRAGNKTLFATFPDDTVGYYVKKARTGDLFLTMKKGRKVYRYVPETGALEFVLDLPSVSMFAGLADIDYDAEGTLFVRCIEVRWTASVGSLDIFKDYEFIGYIENGQYVQLDTFSHDDRWKAAAATDMNKGFWVAAARKDSMPLFKYYTKNGLQRSVSMGACDERCPGVFDMVRDRNNNFWLSFDPLNFSTSDAYMTVFNPGGVTFSEHPPGIEADLEIFPNPAQNELHLRFPVHWELGAPVSASVYDITGRKILEEAYSIGSTLPREEVISFPPLRPGTYVLRVSYQGEYFVKRIFVHQ